jgi:iron-sulfur cluster assembly accessory protein
MAIEITDAVVARVHELVSQGKLPAGAPLRVGVKGGGCAGYSYVFEFNSKRRLSDKVFQKDAVTLLVDPKSLPLIDGMTLDFERSLMNQAFVFRNPNAKSSCGCGVSFGV